MGGNINRKALPKRNREDVEDDYLNDRLWQLQQDQKEKRRKERVTKLDEGENHHCPRCGSDMIMRLDQHPEGTEVECMDCHYEYLATDL